MGRQREVQEFGDYQRERKTVDSVKVLLQRHLWCPDYRQDDQK